VKKIIYTEKAPKPVGPYSQAVVFENTVYISGQIAIDPVSGKLVTDTVENETKQVIQNIDAILLAAGTNKANVLKCTVFVSDISLYEKINAVYTSYFGEEGAPARELVQVAKLPKLVNVEISAIALLQ